MSLPAQTGGHLRFAITAIDRYGNESLALQSAPADSDTDHAPTLLRCDGYRLEVPAGARMADTGLLLIESLQGQTVASRSWRGSQISVADIAPESMCCAPSTARASLTVSGISSKSLTPAHFPGEGGSKPPHNKLYIRFRLTASITFAGGR